MTTDLANAYYDSTNLNSFDPENPPFNWAGYWSENDHGRRMWGPYPEPVGLERGYLVPVQNPGGIDVEPPR